MATRSSSQIDTVPRAGVDGNLHHASRKFTGTEVAGGNIADGDIVRVFKLPAGTEIHDAQAWPSAATANLTMKLGYLPVDGSAGDDDAIIVSGAFATAARVRANAVVSPLVLAKESYIVMTLAGAATLAATEITTKLSFTYNPPL